MILKVHCFAESSNVPQWRRVITKFRWHSVNTVTLPELSMSVHTCYCMLLSISLLMFLFSSLSSLDCLPLGKAIGMNDYMIETL